MAQTFSEKIPIHCQLTDFLKQMRQQGFIRRRSIGRTALVPGEKRRRPPEQSLLPGVDLTGVNAKPGR